MKTEQQLKELVDQMSIEQKVGAVMTLGFNGTVPTQNIYEYVEKYHCGGLRLTPHMRSFPSYIDPQTGETVVSIAEDRYFYKDGVNPPELTAQEYAETLNDLKRRAGKRPLGLPLHFSFDHEGDGKEANCAFDGVHMFPKPLGIRATGDPSLAKEAAYAIGSQTKSIGFNYVHSPVLDILSEPRNPEVYNRSYSDQAEVVAEWATYACQGFKEAGTIATGKHFPGRGDSSVDSHFHVPEIRVDKETMMARELLPYRELIKRDLLPSVMIAHSIFPAFDESEIATVSPRIITDLLRDKLGFEGVITTDSMTMAGIARRYGVPSACAMALKAGADLILMKAQNSLVDECYTEIMHWVQSGKLTEAELDDRILRIFKLKNEYGLFDDSEADTEAIPKALNSQRVETAARQIADHAVTVARVSPGALPLPKDEPVLVIEQIVTGANNATTRPGLLYSQCAAINSTAAYLEIGLSADEEDAERVERIAQKYQHVIFLNYYRRGARANNQLIERVAAVENTNLVVLTNTPYRLSIPPAAKNVILSYGYTPECLRAAAEVVFGLREAKGVWPVSNSDIERTA